MSDLLPGLPGKVTPVSLAVPAELSEASTVDALRLVGQLAGASPWWASALLIHAEDHFGERVGQIAEALGWPPQTVSNLIWVGRAIPISRRREHLSFAHHALVAKMEPKEQAQWLDRAEKGDGPGERWSSRRLRAEVKGLTAPEPVAATPCSRCGGSGVEPELPAGMPKAIGKALDEAKVLGGVKRLRSVDYWKAAMKAFPHVVYEDEILKAEAWLAANRRAPQKDLARFVHNWLGKAEADARED